MQKSKKYTMVKFPPEVIKEAYSLFCGFLPKKYRDLNVGFEINYKNESWKFDNKEEFLSEYLEEIDGAMFIYTHSGYLFQIGYYSGNQTSVTISLPTRQNIEKVFNLIEDNYEKYKRLKQVSPENLEKIRNMEKRKDYQLVKFPPEVIKEAHSVFRSCIDEKDESQFSSWYINYGNESWELSNSEEFFSEYRKKVNSAMLSYRISNHSFGFDYRSGNTRATVSLLSRQDIEKVFEVLEANYDKYRLSKEESRKALAERVKVFIGHGRSKQWRDLKDHLQDKHRFEVVAYETGSRAGYSISEILEEMSEEVSIAFLVHTAEDEGKDGICRARENVIHETGLFQGKLGFKRAIVLLEDGCNEFSNISGIQQLRFGKDNIKEIFGEVLSTIYREFGAETENDG